VFDRWSLEHGAAASRAGLPVVCSLRGEGVGGLTVQCVGARVPADHLEAQSGKAGFQLTSSLLERLDGDLLTDGSQRSDACT
jgi:hypothetical protein